MTNFVLEQLRVPIQLGGHTFPKAVRNGPQETVVTYVKINEEGDLVFGVPSGLYRASHAHQYAIAVAILAGTGTFRLGDQELSYEPNLVFYVRPGIEHGIMKADVSTVIRIKQFSESL